LKILIAECENISRMVLEASLKRHDHEVVAVENGLKAWEAFQKQYFPSEAQFTHGYCPECYEKYMKSNFSGEEISE
jgi:hypothetical protein